MLRCVTHYVYSHPCGRLALLHGTGRAEHHNIDATARVRELGDAADSELREVALTQRRQLECMVEAAQNTTENACRHHELVSVT